MSFEKQHLGTGDLLGTVCLLLVLTHLQLMPEPPKWVLSKPPSTWQLLHQGQQLHTGCLVCVLSTSLETLITSSILIPQLKTTTKNPLHCLSDCSLLQLKREKKLEVVMLGAVSSCYSCSRPETVFNWQLKGISLPKGKKSCCVSWMSLYSTNGALG